MVLIDQNVFV